MAAPRIVYLNGEYLPSTEAKISVDDRGFLFADGVYEAIKAYNGYIFTEREHMARMRRGLSELRIEAGDVLEEVARVSRELLVRNDLLTGDALIYVQITRGAAPRAHAFPNPPVPLTVYAYAKAFQNPSAETLATGVHAVSTQDTRWARCDIKSIALLPNVLANQLAKEVRAAPPPCSRAWHPLYSPPAARAPGCPAASLSAAAIRPNCVSPGFAARASAVTRNAPPPAPPLRPAAAHRSAAATSASSSATASSSRPRTATCSWCWTASCARTRSTTCCRASPAA